MEVQTLVVMAYLTLFLITILAVTSGATPLHCSDVRSPAASGSHDTDPSQLVTTLEYCIIDNCTIMRIDTGQQLDIVYTTDSLLIVTPIDDHTSMVIAKTDDETFCLKHQSTSSIKDILIAVLFPSLTLLMMIMSAYILIVHLLFKELRTLFGKLLIFYSLSILSMCGSSVALSVMHRHVMVNSQTICHTAMIVFTIANTWVEVSATNMLIHLAYIMYRCYHMKSQISNKVSKFLYRCYNAHAFITLILLFFLTIAYDLRTGNGRYTLLPNGHCHFIDRSMTSYMTIYLSDIFAFINKFAQITMFVAYLVYFYKLKMIMNDLQACDYNRELFRIAIAMGATVGLSRFLWLPIMFDSQYSYIFGVSGVISLFIQLAVITTSFLCTKKMSNLCRAYFSRQNNTQT